MGNCLNPIFRAKNYRSSHNAHVSSRTTSRLGLFSGPSTSTWMTPSTLTVPSYSQVRASDCIPTPRTEGEILSSPNLKTFTLEELKKATGNFSHVVGRGGFGRVYRGWIDEQTLTPSKPGSGMVVAVKRLTPEGFQGHKEWLTEINYLGKLQHPNVVKLFGFCSECDNRILVYEFMLNGSLDKHLFQRGAQPLPWATRIEIARGAAKGLSFLHDGEIQIIYRDVKASNILLDLDFNAKLSDFGLARDGPIEDMTHVTTRVVGTIGYLAPEYFATGQLSSKADVYSFGVLLLEILSGRRAYDMTKSDLEQNLLDQAKSSLSDKPLSIIDSKLEGQYPKAAACAAVKIALQCTVKEPKLRPHISKVLAALENL